jgi:hypothetical protein
MALTLHGTVSDNTVALDRKTATPLIINGDMAIAQRGTSFSSLSSSQYCLDRFSNDIGGGGAITVTQDTDVPSNEFTKSMKLVVATADSSIAGSDAYRITHSVEGQNIATVGLGTSGCQTMTLTFWVRSSVTGTYGIGFQNSAETENYVDEYAISSANTWEKKVINIPVRTSGTWLTTNGVGLGIRWDLGSGTNYNGTADQWQTTSGKVYRTSSCVNWIATASATFYITGVQLELGTFDTNSLPDFQHEDAGTSLARCQRYFQIQVSGSTGSGYANGSFRTNNNAQITHHFRTEMRANPTCTQIAGSNMIAHDTADGNNITITSIDSLLFNSNGGAIIAYNLSGTSAAAGDGCWIYNTGSTPGITFDSEL